MNWRRQSIDDVAVELRRRTDRFDAGTPVPTDLFERVSAPRPRPRRLPRVLLRQWSTPVVGALAVVGVLVGAAVGWSVRGSGHTAPPGSAGPVVLRVYNAQVPCQHLRTMECALSLTNDPRYLDFKHVVAHLWHGDEVTADCVVPNGQGVTDEAGVTSTRWYRVTTTAGITGYLPGVRTRNTVDMRRCPS
jgi:hypothetical protein